MAQSSKRLNAQSRHALWLLLLAGNEPPSSLVTVNKAAAIDDSLLADPATSLLGHYRRRAFLHRLGVLHLAEMEIIIEQKQSSAIPPPLPLGVNPQSCFANLWNRPDRFYKHTRVTESEFLILLHELESPIIRGHATSINNINRVHQSLSAAEQLLLWIYHSDGNDDDIIALLFGNIDRRSVSRVADLITEVINEVYKSELDWPDAREREDSHGLFALDDHAIAVIDGSHCEITIPSHNESSFYNAHKGFHSKNYMLFVNALGYYIHVSKGFNGRRNDRGIFNDLDLSAIPLSPGELFIADGGFTGEGPLITPYSSSTIHAENVTPIQQHAAELLNDNLTLDRSLVEHAVHVLKNRAQSLCNRFSRNHEALDNLVLAAARLCNRLRSIRLDAVWA